MPPHDYYTILGISRSASEIEIKTAYRQQALASHPDRNPNDSKAEERFKQVSEAYSILSDPVQRTQYDRDGQTLEDKLNARTTAAQQYYSYSQHSHPTSFRTVSARCTPDFLQSNFLYKYADHAITGILAVTALSAAYTYNFGLNVPPFTWLFKPEDLTEFYQHGTVDTAKKITDLWFGTALGLVMGATLTALAEISYTIRQKVKRI